MTNTRTILLFCVTVSALLSEAFSQTVCAELPSDSTISDILRSVEISSGGEGADITVEVTERHFTCIAGTGVSQIATVAVAVKYNIVNAMGSPNRESHLQMECQSPPSGYRLSTSGNALERNPPAIAFNVTLRRNCFLCTGSTSGGGGTTIDTNANCAECSSQCRSEGQGLCKTTVNDCCPFYEGGVCVDMCSENRTATEASNFTCVCKESFVEINASVCRHVCDPNPCQNGGTCTANGTNTMCLCPPEYTGASCSSERPMATPTPVVSVVPPTTTPPSQPTTPSCPANCDRCSSSVCCTVCDDGYEIQSCNCVQVMCPERCRTCFNSSCCRECDPGFQLVNNNGRCSCENLLPTTPIPPVCTIANCTKCSFILDSGRMCCDECQSGHKKNDCLCGDAVGPPTNDAALTAGIAIGVVLLVILLLGLALLAAYLIYAFVTHGMDPKRTKPLTPFGSNGDAHDNPLYIPPKELDDD